MHLDPIRTSQTPSRFTGLDSLAGLSPNARAIEAWNTVLFEKFCRYEDILVAGLGRHGTALFDIAPPRPGSRASS